MTPGSSLPSISSNEAPPPVLMWLIAETSPVDWTKLAVSPPPIMLARPREWPATMAL